MPKFSKTCNNPLHSEWSETSEGLEGSIIVNLKAFGWLQLAEALAMFLASEKQIETTKKISQLCKNCIHQCLKKRKVTRYLHKQLSTDVIEKKVRNMFAELPLFAVLLMTKYTFY